MPRVRDQLQILFLENGTVSEPRLRTARYVSLQELRRLPPISERTCRGSRAVGPPRATVKLKGNDGWAAHKQSLPALVPREVSTTFGVLCTKYHVITL